MSFYGATKTVVNGIGSVFGIIPIVGGLLALIWQLCALPIVLFAMLLDSLWRAIT